MAFHFTLEAVLRLRQSLEDRELLRLQTLLARRAALLHEREQTRQTGLDLQGETKRALQQQSTPAVEIHFAMARWQALERRRQVIGEQLGELESVIVEQRSLFEQQRRNRRFWRRCAMRNCAIIVCCSSDVSRRAWTRCTCCERIGRSVRN